MRGRKLIQLGVWFAGVAGIVAAGGAWGQADTTTYQGVLRTPQGDPVPDGAVDIRVRIFDAATGGTPLFSETHNGVATQDGVFSIEIGSVTALNELFQNNADTELFLELAADLGNGFETYSPRIPFTRTPYAFHATEADVAGVATNANNAAQASAVDWNDVQNKPAGFADDTDDVDGGDAATLDGATRADLEESSEITAAIDAHDTASGSHQDIRSEIDNDIAAHNADNSAHPAIRTEIDDDIAAHDGDGSAHSDIRAEIDSDIAAHDGDGSAHSDIRAEIDNDIAAHDANTAAHENMEIEAAQITSGKINNARLNTGPGNGLDADTVDGMEASDFAEVLNDLADVAASTPTDGDLLAWDDGQSRWENTPAPPAIDDQSSSDYIRIGDLQIAWGVKPMGPNLPGSDVRTVDFTFPAAFSEVPVVTNGINGDNAGWAYAVFDSAVTTTTYLARVREIEFRQATGTVLFNYMAIGKWR